MDESSQFWFAAVWTLLGALFTIFAFSLSIFVTFVKRDLILPLLDEILGVLRTTRDHSESLRVVRVDVAALMTAVTALGQSHAQMLRTLQELRTDVQALANEHRQTREAVTRFMTDPQAPARPVLLEILTELRNRNRGDPQIQRGLRAFTLPGFLEAQAAVLARERIQANPNPFHDLD